MIVRINALHWLVVYVNTSWGWVFLGGLHLITNRLIRVGIGRVSWIPWNRTWMPVCLGPKISSEINLLLWKSLQTFPDQRFVSCINIENTILLNNQPPFWEGSRCFKHRQNYCVSYLQNCMKEAKTFVFVIVRCMLMLRFRDRVLGFSFCVMYGRDS